VVKFKISFIFSFGVLESAKRAGPKNNKPKLSPYGNLLTSMRFGRKRRSSL